MAQKLSNLANKSKVKFGSLYGSPIVWIVADKNHAGYPSNSVTLVTNQIIKMLCFDATEPSNGNSHRRGYGNNRYIFSNLRQWLNSPAAAGQCYTAHHSADQPPDSPHVWNGVRTESGYRHLDLTRGADSRGQYPLLSDREMAALGYQWDTQAVPPCGEPSDSQEGTEEVPGTSSASSDGAE